MGVYHPAIFDLLRKTLVVTRRAAHRGETCAIDHITTQHRTALRAAWARTQLEQGVADVGANATTPAARERRFDGWFDGFRTLAFIHAARDSGLANVPWREAFDQATFVPSADSDAFGYRQQLLYLEQGRE